MNQIYNQNNYSECNYLNQIVVLNTPFFEKITLKNTEFSSLEKGKLFLNISEKRKGEFQHHFKIIDIDLNTSIEFLEKSHSFFNIKNSNQIILRFEINYKYFLRFFDFELNNYREIETESAPVYFYNDFLYGSTNSGEFHKLDLFGNIIWRTLMGIKNPLLAMNEKYLFYYLRHINSILENQDFNRVICLSQNTGEIIWKIYIENLNKNLPILLAKEFVIIESDFEGIICLDVKTGTKIWNKKVIEGKKNRRYTLDYEQILHVIEVDIYLQINISDGSIIRQFDMKKEFKKLKIDLFSLANENDFGNLLGMPSFQPTVTSTHFLVSVLSMILFINKSTGMVDSTYNCTNNRSQVAELAVIADNRVVIIESVWSGAFKGNILKVFEGNG